MWIHLIGLNFGASSAAICSLTMYARVRALALTHISDTSTKLSFLQTYILEPCRHLFPPQCICDMTSRLDGLTLPSSPQPWAINTHAHHVWQNRLISWRGVEMVWNRHNNSQQWPSRGDWREAIRTFVHILYWFLWENQQNSVEGI